MHKMERLLSAAVTLGAVVVFVAPWTIALTHVFHAGLHRVP